MDACAYAYMFESGEDTAVKIASLLVEPNSRPLESLYLNECALGQEGNASRMALRFVHRSGRQAVLIIVTLLD